MLTITGNPLSSSEFTVAQLIGDVEKVEKLVGDGGSFVR